MNFIFFIPDELRAESVGCYSHPLVQTPNMDRLAREGVRFDQCHVQHTVCTPSRCSFMTGWYPHVRGHRSLWHLLRPDEPNLLKYLKQAGYHIYWNGGHNDLLAPESFADSVDEYHNSGGPSFSSNPHPPEHPLHHSFMFEPNETPIEEHGDMAKVLHAIEFIKNRPQDKPFVIFLPLTFPHPPYCAPAKWHDMYDPKDIPPLRSMEVQNKPNYYEKIRSTRGIDKCDDDVFRQINATYLGMTSFMDHILGEMLTTLDETNLAEDTALFYFADHGDYAGDYGLVEKWPSGLEDPLIRVPLLVRAPGCKPGHVVDEQVELFDIMATSLDLAGIEAEHAHFAKSLVPQLQGGVGDPDRLVFAEGGYSEHEVYCMEGSEKLRQTIHKGENMESFAYSVYHPKCQLQQDHPETVGRCSMVRSMTHKYIRRENGEHELYDLCADPGEINNIYGDDSVKEIQNHLEKELLDWYLRTSDVTPFHEDPRGLPPKNSEV